MACSGIVFAANRVLEMETGKINMQERWGGGMTRRMTGSNVYSCVLTFLLFFWVSGSIAFAWNPPVGIPAPPWPADLDVPRPALPAPWTSEQSGFYYIDPSGCSDTGRTYGRPGAPRCSLPPSPSAGSIIVVNGTINGSKVVSYTGTSGSPIWIIGSNTNSMPTLAGDWDLTGSSYVILDSLTWSYNARDGVSLDGNHIVVRNCTMENPYDTSNGAGFGIGGTNIVFYKNTISQMGDWQYTGGADIDRLGIKVYAPAADVWIVDSLFYHCHSDGVQVGDQQNTANQINRIYIGRNTAYENYQFGYWTKNATDVIFSQNVSYNHKTDSVSGPGGGMGGQYDPKYVWYLLNKIYNSNSGIHVAGASSGGGGPWYMIGNLIYGIQYSGACSAYDAGGLGFRNSGTAGMFFNTLYDTDIFVSLAPGGGTVTIKDNIFASKKTACSAFENAGVPFLHDYNLFSQSSYDPESESHRVLGDPKFINPVAFDFRLQASSPAIGRANPSEEPAFAIFHSRYGIDIRKDIAGEIRPQGSWDIGAFEFPQGVVDRPIRIPLPPTDVRVN